MAEELHQFGYEVDGLGNCKKKSIVNGLSSLFGKRSLVIGFNN